MADALQFVVPIRNFLRRQRWYLHNNVNIRGLTDTELRIRYRFGSQAINYITNLLYDDLACDTGRNFALNPDVQVLIALRLFASGSFLQVIGTYALLYPINENSLSNGRQIKKRKQLKTNFTRWTVSHMLLVASIVPIFEFRHHTITRISMWIGNTIIPSMSKQFRWQR
jgi:hypothetical protein